MIVVISSREFKFNPVKLQVILIQVDDIKRRPPIFKKKIENEKNVVNFKGKFRF